MKSRTVANWQKRVLRRDKEPERLFKIVDKVLKEIFGEAATLFIYKHLEEKHSLKREDIVDELEIFTEGLEKYLGDSGTLVVLENLFNESSQLKLGKFEEREFLEQLKGLKRSSYR